MSSLVQYGSYEIDAVEEDANKAQALSGSKFMDLVEGDNIARMIPPKVGMRSPFRVTALHYVELPGLDKLIYACPRVELKEQCVTCQQAEALMKGDKASKSLAYDIKAKLKVYACCLDRAVADPMLGLRVLGMGKQIHNGLKKLRTNKRRGGDWTNPTAVGFDVVIDREGTGMATTYTVAKGDVGPLADNDDLIGWLIENQIDLDTYVDPVTPDEILNAWASATQIQVPGIMPVAPAPARAGAGLMAGRGKASMTATMARAVIDAKAEVKYDDDFNVIT